MKTRDLERIGIPAGAPAETAKQLLQRAHAAKRSMDSVLTAITNVAAAPASFVDDPLYGELASQLVAHARATGLFHARPSATWSSRWRGSSRGW